MRVKVLFFGMLREMAGRSEDEIDLPAGSSVETVFEHYASQIPRLREMAGSIVSAKNQEFVPADATLGEGDEVAFMPPVSGGSESSPWLAQAEEPDGSFYALTGQPIDVRALARRLLQDSDGAVITFEGVVRNNSGGRRTRFLEYECYRPMALNKMREIGRSILENHLVERVGMVHRLGRLEIGETSVAIAVTSAHRRPAYEASFEAINRLKRLVPIWKKEHFEDGEVWVEGDWEDSVPRAARTPQ